MKIACFFLLLFAGQPLHAMMTNDSKKEIEQLKQFVAEHGIAALSKEAREYFEEKGVNFSRLTVPKNHSLSSSSHREVVEDFIKKYGHDAVSANMRSQIVANGWHTQSEIMAQFAPGTVSSFFEQNKIPIILAAAVAVGLISYEIIASYNDESDEEKQEANS